MFLMMASPSFGQTTLKQVQIVTRHGARTPLPKTALVQENSEDPVLTPLGQLEHYQLGLWLRNRYSGLQVIDTYNESLTNFDSSYYIRTIVSANSLALGLFPDRGPTLLPANVTPANIPVHEFAALHDISIRAYENCPQFQVNLAALYQSDLWTQYQSDHMDLLQSLAQIPYFAPYANFGTYVLLSQVWNVYDAIQVSKTECGISNTSEFCVKYSNPALVNILSSTSWTELKQVAQFAELTKYGIPTAQNLLGSNLLVDILEGMGVTDFNVTDSMTAPALTFRMYSAHYPTILSIFSALKIVFKNLDGIPNYASALIFELWEDNTSDSFFVRVLFKDGYSNIAVPVPLEYQCGGAVNCSLANFSSLLNSISFTTPGDWCEACNNTSADVCLANLLSIARNDAAAATATCSSSGFSKGAIAGSFFGGVGAMALIVLVGYCLLKAKG
jgi:hypothetical protein